MDDLSHQFLVDATTRVDTLCNEWFPLRHLQRLGQPVEFPRARVPLVAILAVALGSAVLAGIVVHLHDIEPTRRM